MKLIIDIPEEMHEQIKDGYVPLGISKYLKNGTPLDDVKAEIIYYNDKHCNSEFISVGTVFAIIDKHIGRK